MEKSRDAIQISEATGYKKGLSEGLLAVGFCYLQMGQKIEAKNALLQSLQLLKGGNQKEAQVEALQLLAEATSDADETLAFLGEALALAAADRSYLQEQLVQQRQQTDAERQLKEAAMKRLQQTEVQLVQLEKMASLGELT
ncbi:MAG: hypothetical protein EOO88_48150, partial [Pedobacter sp.]